MPFGAAPHPSILGTLLQKKAPSASTASVRFHPYLGARANRGDLRYQWRHKLRKSQLRMRF